MARLARARPPGECVRAIFKIQYYDLHFCSILTLSWIRVCLDSLDHVLLQTESTTTVETGDKLTPAESRLKSRHTGPAQDSTFFAGRSCLPKKKFYWRK